VLATAGYQPVARFHFRKPYWACLVARVVWMHHCWLQVAAFAAFELSF